MLARASSLALLLVCVVCVPAQDARPLTHADYDSWKSIRSRTPSPDGNWIAWSEAPQEGDGVLVIAHAEGERQHRIPLGTGARFSPDSRFLVCRLGKPFADQLAEERKRALGGRSGPSASPAAAGPLTVRGRRPGGGRRGRGGGRGAGGSGDDDSKIAILELATGKVTELEGVSSFKMPTEGAAWIVFERKEKKAEPKPEDAQKPGEGEAKEGEGEPRRQRSRRGGRRRGGEGRRRRGEGSRPPASAEEAKPTELVTPPAEGETTEPTAPALKSATAGASTPPAEATAAKEPKAKKAKATEAAAKPAKKDEKKPVQRWRKAGKKLVLRELATGTETELEHVSTNTLIGDGGWLIFGRNTKADDESKVERGLFAHKLGQPGEITLVEGAANFERFAKDRDDKHIAFYSDRRDRAAKEPTFDIWLWDMNEAPAKMVVSHTATAGVPDGYRLSRAGGLSWSRDGSTLRLAVEPMPDPELEKILARHEVKLDLWHFKDPMLQPMQARRRGATNRRLTTVWHADQDQLTVLAKHGLESVRFLTPDGARALVTDSRPYLHEVSWDGRYSDLYVVNTIDGSRRLLAKHVGGRTSSSPCGRYVLRFADEHWHAHDLVTGKVANLTAKLSETFADELWDRPADRGPYGIAGWVDDRATVLVNARYDVWSIALDGSSATVVTDGLGRASRTRFRYRRTDREERWVATGSPLLFEAFNTQTKASGVWEDVLGEVRRPKKLMMEDMRVSDLNFPQDGSRVYFSMSRFDVAPEVWVANAKDLSDRVCLSNIGAQQNSFSWGQAELVNWRNLQGKPIQGILVKPDGFDPKKKYPMMVYFYERRSDRLHSYVNPAPGTSPNASYYVSNGYLWFIPDIYYREGYPGESAMSCVVSGVQHLLNQGFVDENAIGAAGHSWGGYQTAYLVTRTNIFKAVESGAPVSNMTSAYGGIRWGSGMSRAFQYEKTQSRIGGTLWDYPMRYIENSPVFYADKVETPVLMLHNDKDGAVPWYQGIEYFCALRRLGKEVYMFNYNGADHGLRKRANTMDWTMRMQQYFDHHLRGHDAPEWMVSGVPFADREREKRRFRPETVLGEEEPEVEVQPKPAPAAEPAPEVTLPAGAGQ